MAELKPEPTTSSKTESHTRTPADSSSTQSAAQAHTQAHEDTAPVVYKVNESILARWVTGDKGFYPARIMSVTGSATAPMYTVKFKSYDTIETLRARDIRSIAPPNSNSGGSSASSSATKRKADGSSVGAGDAAASHRGSATPLSPPTSTATPPPPPPAAVPAPPQPPQTSQSYGQPPPPPPPSSTPAVVAAAPPVSTAIPPPSRFRTIDRFSQGVVSSAQPQLYNKPPSQQQQQQQQQWSSGGAVTNAGSSSGPATNATPLGEEPPVKKFKKIKANKQLEAGKSKWQEFSSKGKTGKPGTKKDSMFRTPDGPQGRGKSSSPFFFVQIKLQ